MPERKQLSTDDDSPVVTMPTGPPPAGNDAVTIAAVVPKTMVGVPASDLRDSAEGPVPASAPAPEVTADDRDVTPAEPTSLPASEPPAPPPPVAAGADADAPPQPPGASGPSTVPAFVPPEMLARRRAAMPPNRPYQPIAGRQTTPPDASDQTYPGQPRPAAPGDGPAPATGAIDRPGAQTTAAAGSTAAAAPGAAAPTALAGTAAPESSLAAMGMTGPARPITGPITGPVERRTTTSTAGSDTGSLTGTQTGDLRPAGPAGPTAGNGQDRARRRLLLAAVAGLAVVAAAVAVGIGVSGGGSGSGPAAAPDASPSATAAEPVTVKVSSFSEKGNGFRPRGTTWVTQTYASEHFGNLKSGLGLVVDVGSARALTSVGFDTATGPITVELRSADQRPSTLRGWTAVGGSGTASGATSLDAAKGGKHRYWLIWVSRLGPSYRAVLSNVSATAS